MYSKSVVGLSGVGLVDVDDSLSEVVLGGFAIVDSLKSQDDLVDMQGNF